MKKKKIWRRQERGEKGRDEEGVELVGRVGRARGRWGGHRKKGEGGGVQGGDIEEFRGRKMNTDRREKERQEVTRGSGRERANTRQN